MPTVGRSNAAPLARALLTARARLGPLFLGVLLLAGGTGLAGLGAVARQAAAREPAPGRPIATARYLANEGVLVVAGDTRVAFDPIFRKGYDQYQMLPPELERALFAGEPPFDGLDAVFVSHYHEDHFSPTDLRRLLEVAPALRLYAPAQAVATMNLDAGGAGLRSRITAIDLDAGDPPLELEEGSLRVEAVRVPHAGWPERNRDVQNVVYRVTLDDTATVVHLGDADARETHFARDAGYWGRRRSHAAFPPFWFFLSEEGRRVLDQRIGATTTVGVHVPTSMPRRPEDRPAELRERDLFLVPGETRELRE